LKVCAGTWLFGDLFFLRFTKFLRRGLSTFSENFPKILIASGSKHGFLSDFPVMHVRWADTFSLRAFKRGASLLTACNPWIFFQTPPWTQVVFFWADFG